MSSDTQRGSLQRPVINKDPGVVLTVLTSSYQLAVKGTRATKSFLARVQQNCQGRIIWKFLRHGFLWHLTPRWSHPGYPGSIIHALSLFPHQIYEFSIIKQLRRSRFIQNNLSLVTDRKVRWVDNKELALRQTSNFCY